MTIPNFLSALLVGITLTIDEITKYEPEGFWVHFGLPNDMPGSFMVYLLRPGEYSIAILGNLAGAT
ncbi:hypothetical protein PG997_009216 [Apiospora hydei]|uniref:Uncharacterized protein n=1 Tax=Apiospora hydei TaxID=1337664 RepID=A0ABR1VXJ0_9PEZI